MRTLDSLLGFLLLRRPFWERSFLRRVVRLGIYAVYIYVGIVLILLALEDHLLYLPAGPERWFDPPAGLAVEDVSIVTPIEGEEIAIHAWWAEPEGWKPEDGAVLLCHGNGGNLSYRGEMLASWIKEMGQAALLFDYPGYGKSEGRCSEAGCYAAADAAYDWLTEAQHVPPGRIILYGGSLGGGVATDLARRRPHRALVLLGPFTSIPDMAQELYPWMPARWLVRNQFDNRAKIADCPGPVFIAHGEADTLIPMSQARELYALAPEPKEFLSLPDWWHVDSPPASFYPALRDFLARAEGR
jgi:pimeloyl-ACP methyl ester carboxylesterase